MFGAHQSSHTSPITHCRRCALSSVGMVQTRSGSSNRSKSRSKKYGCYSPPARSSLRSRSRSRSRCGAPKKTTTLSPKSTNFSTTMSPLQEHLNALSMVFPFLAVHLRYFYLSSRPYPISITTWLTSPPLLYVLITTVHAPFSIVYHHRQALGLDPSRLDNRYRLLDQTFIHVCCQIYSYTMSGSLAYAASLIPLNSYSIYCLWRGGRSSYGKPVQVKLQVRRVKFASREVTT